MERLYNESTSKVSNNDLSLLKEVHINSSGLKALTTSVTSDGIEVCRKCCGGHGYSKFSGLVDLLGNYIPANTYEGENTLLFLQCARNLLKTFIDATTGKKPATGLISYYNDISILDEKCVVQNTEDWLTPIHQLKCFVHRSFSLINSTGNRFIEALQTGSTFEQAFEVCKVDLVRCAKAHCWHVIFSNFLAAVQDSSNPAEVKVILSALCSLFALTQIVDGLADLNEDWYLTQDQIIMLREQVRRSLSIIRKDAVALVDAFDFSDAYLNSAIGRWDGNVYECLYKWAQSNNPMNDPSIDFRANDILLPLLANGLKKSQ
jgi:acyl-CoA oxidase